MIFACAQCGLEADKATGAVNRARRLGLRLFCDRTCAGIARRKGKSLSTRRAEKSAYDAQYRITNKAVIKEKKAEYYRATYHPEKAAEKRRERSAYHADYCRRPEYRTWKRAYDQRHRAHKYYNDFSDAFLVLTDLEREVLSRMTRYEIGMANGTICKTQKRRREHARLISG